MMKLAVPAVEQAWACTTAESAASPAPYYEAPLQSSLPWWEGVRGRGKLTLILR